MCRENLDRLQKFHGLEVLTAVEYEFTTLAKQEAPGPLVAVNGAENRWAPAFSGVEIFSMLKLAPHMGFCATVEDGMRRVGVDVLAIHTEYGTSTRASPRRESD